ncbi:MFS transporter [Acidihalobacter ferrooxydans]|uniref:MFS transporter n=1 Tax=Acidihalobacter ferrooxydans TaxID=1765967 RepID=A0A1P8UF27_9GAMM|nr:MFS transporter [Acidihalobacter ferrooxydans]APZ42442.1 MFS transporter [Acidihalobacter ferrooxydans]
MTTAAVIPLPGTPVGQSRVHPSHAAMTQLLDTSPMHPFHYRLWALSTGGTLLSGVSMFLLGAALPLLAPAFDLKAYQLGLIGALLMVGTVVGGMLGGHLADRFGRKPIMLLDMLLLVAAAVGSAFAEHWDLLLVMQLLVGVGIGMDYPVGSSYLAEYMPQGRRGHMLAASISIQSAGMLVAGGFALALLAQAHSGDATWRWLFASEALLALPYLVIRLRLPESVRWYISRGRNADAARVLAKLFPEQAHALQEHAQRLGSHIHNVSKLTTHQHGDLRALFTRAYRRRTLLVTLPWFFMDIATYGVGLFTVVLLASLHPVAATVSLIGHDLLATRNSIQVDIFLLLGSLASIWAVPRFGRIHMQLTGFVGMALGMGLLVFSTLGHASTPDYALLIFLGFVLYNLFMTVGPNATTFILPTEMYPTQVRATGAGFAAASSKVGATLGVFLLPVLKNSLGVTATLAFIVLVSLLGLISTWAFRVRGRGRTLEQHHRGDLP